VLAAHLPSSVRRERELPFHGACLDTGAQKSVIGLPQALAYARFTSQNISTRTSHSAFRFGDGRQVSLGLISIRFPMADGHFFDRDVDVVPADVPLLMGLDLMDEVGLLFDNTTNQLIHPLSGWSLPVVRKLGQAYM
jgi:hypothetical protein